MDRNKASTQRIPLFPLGLVLLPRMPLPLHIFEDRYRLMIDSCLRTDSPFGVVLNTGSTLQTIGCLAGIDSVINRYDDGRIDILVVGTTRFRIQAMHETRAFLEADVVSLSDDGTDVAVSSDLLREATDALRDFALTAGYTIEDQLLNSLSLEELSFLLATTDIFSMADRQHFIELRSTAERIRVATRALRENAEKQRMKTKVRAILGDNADIANLFN